MQDDTESQQDKIYDELRKKYKRMTISKSEMSSELGISNSTLDLYIAIGYRVT